MSLTVLTPPKKSVTCSQEATAEDKNGFRYRYADIYLYFVSWNFTFWFGKFSWNTLKIRIQTQIQKSEVLYFLTCKNT